MTPVKKVPKKKHRRSLTSTVQFDGTPVFYGLALTLQDARDHGWHGSLTSADRRKGVAERYGKMSQAFLFSAWVAWSTRRALLRPFTRNSPPNPANSPGHSSHELRSDAVAFRGPVGRPLAWWQLGLDVSNAPELVVVLNKLGYSAHRPYRTASEAHHVNLRKSPSGVIRRRKLRRKVN